MARVCALTGKGPQSGNRRSHSCIATRRSWGVNLVKVKTDDGRTIKISARALRTLKKAA